MVTLFKTYQNLQQPFKNYQAPKYYVAINLKISKPQPHPPLPIVINIYIITNWYIIWNAHYIKLPILKHLPFFDSINNIRNIVYQNQIMNTLHKICTFKTTSPSIKQIFIITLKIQIKLPILNKHFLYHKENIPQ